MNGTISAYCWPFLLRSLCTVQTLNQVHGSLCGRRLMSDIRCTFTTVVLRPTVQMSAYCHFLLPVQALKKHISTVHCGPGAVSHACASCPMTFNNCGNLLRRFLRIHRGLRHFICGICGTRYGHNQDLGRHLKAKHHVDIPVISGVDKKAVSEVEVPSR
jgi:hypothetical protein